MQNTSPDNRVGVFECANLAFPNFSRLCAILIKLWTNYASCIYMSLSPTKANSTGKYAYIMDAGSSMHKKADGDRKARKESCTRKTRGRVRQRFLIDQIATASDVDANVSCLNGSDFCKICKFYCELHDSSFRSFLCSLLFLASCTASEIRHQSLSSAPRSAR